MEADIWSHCHHRIVGSDGENQVVPSLKEVMAWSAETARATTTVYLELVPLRPDSVDTVLYALDRLKELFIKKLGYTHLIVCGDGVTVNILHMIKVSKSY